MEKKEVENCESPSPVGSVQLLAASYIVLLQALCPCIWALESSPVTLLTSECQFVPGPALIAGVSKKKIVQPQSGQYFEFGSQAMCGFEYKLQLLTVV